LIGQQLLENGFDLYKFDNELIASLCPSSLISGSPNDVKLNALLVAVGDVNDELLFADEISEALIEVFGVFNEVESPLLLFDVLLSDTEEVEGVFLPLFEAIKGDVRDVPLLLGDVELVFKVGVFLSLITTSTLLLSEFRSAEVLLL